MRSDHSGERSSWRAGVAVLAMCAFPCLVVCLAACPGPHGDGPGTSRARAVRKDPTVKLRKFDGHRGVFRIHNGTGRTIRRVAVAIRGVDCKGPRATRTDVKVFDLRLRPGERQSFAFQFEHRCRRAHVAVAAQ